MNKPKNEDNFLIEVSAPLYNRIKQELGDAFIDNTELHFSPYWKMMNNVTKEQENQVSKIVFDLMDVGLITGNYWHGPNAPNDKERTRIGRVERQAVNKIIKLLASKEYGETK